ncbi:hypothetical protein PF002_g8698 [Phytophthora fragariae]|uniref:Uncharacterized protein n=1 Tax=Phytophthora fragariae TaxID=53985 RepID=A0A6A3PEI9_9STRA|nr:hypothetical protein PF003_g27678 [Phytophthora fragariae]KAE9055508.1 hypothetical protein PF006_g32938 [Phytophthora fragariae]KAE9121196.1 hypothetical protein PF007_g7907 [Phytophthora fragariae]KAE9199770.1 hypothetical protein PF004_g19178 [Phytophthora fragariae]KAE9242572.1 hypothetical protein PF002_g8698 [Phytophthora fragariae]
MALPAAADVLPVGDFPIYLLVTYMPLFGEGSHRGRFQGRPGGIRVGMGKWNDAINAISCMFAFMA